MIRFPSYQLFSRSLAALVFAASIALNVSLASRLTVAREAAPHGLTSSDVIRPFVGANRFGESVGVDFSGTLPVVLYHFSPTCTWCERNWANVRALVEQASGRYEFVGISLTPPTEEFMKGRRLSFKIVTGLSDETVHSLRLGGTPQTIVVAPGGRVITSWAGVFAGGQARSVEAFFRVRLPGLVSPSLGQ